MTDPWPPKLHTIIIGGNRTALAVARSIQQAFPSCRIDVAAPARRPLPGYSRMVAHTYRIAPAEDHPSWSRSMLELAARVRTDGSRPFLLPVNDADLLAANKAWPELEPFFSAAFETHPDRLELCLDKLRTAELAGSMGISVPLFGRSIDEYVARGGKFPAVVKPAVKGSAEALQMRLPRIAICADPEELKRAVEVVERAGEPVIQEWIAGEDSALFTVGFASLHGSVLGTFTGRKLRQFPPAAGEASLAESVESPELVALTRRLIGAAGFTGIGQIEFKRDRGGFKLIEINPRPWSWIGLATHCGVNLPALFLRRLLGEYMLAPAQLNGRRWILGLRDLRYNGWPEGYRGVWGWWRDLLDADTHAFMSLVDPIPGVIANIRETKRLFRL